ncbi:chloride channel protein [Bordetella sp. LUAb4]|uniref:chloride channel protein n=1 Tax=Bordetella sp. LUAb4 TaxID=2843195 RepID=UPI001E5767FB|nr:chloride channel protein [Bordetella sp. LUAb4]
MPLEKSSATSSSSTLASTSASVLIFATLLTGVAAGIGGMLLGLLLRLVQHVAYGYGLDAATPHTSFLQGASMADGARRVVVLAICGLVAGFGWWAVYRYGRKLVSVKQAAGPDAPAMPGGATLAHALLQIITVGLGSPLGREVAPREVGALLAGYLARGFGLTIEYRRLLVACGAGAGLAAVYNVPLGGAVFVLEVLVGAFSWPAAAMAMASSALAAWIAWWGLGAESQYVVPHMAVTPALVIWALLLGPLFGVAAHGFVKLTGSARAHAARGWRLPVASLVNFTIIGLLAVYLPQLLGNGKGAASLSFDSELTLGLAALLLVLKVAIEASTLRAGAEGGLLTPGLTNGAMLALIVGGLCNQWLPGIFGAVPLGAYAIVGATAFLASSMSMPLTAIVLLAEFTRMDHDMLVPVVLAVAGSICASRWCTSVVTRRAAAGAVPAPAVSMPMVMMPVSQSASAASAAAVVAQPIPSTAQASAPDLMPTNKQS